MKEREKMTKAKSNGRVVGDKPIWQNRDWLYEQYIVQRKNSFEVAKEAKCAWQTILKWLKRCEVPIRSRREARTEHKELTNRKWLYHEYVELEKSMCRIARELDCSSTAVQKWLKQHNIPARSASEASRRKPCKKIIYKIDPKGCWKVISHRRTANGYPVFRIRKKIVFIHRVAIYSKKLGLTLEEGRRRLILKGVKDLRRVIEEDEFVMHSCDNPFCVNPEHLRLGTKADNTKDKVDRGRQARGEKAGGSKLTEKQVKEIRKLDEQGVSLSGLAQKYMVEYTTIRNIVMNHSWKHLL